MVSVDVKPNVSFPFLAVVQSSRLWLAGSKERATPSRATVAIHWTYRSQGSLYRKAKHFVTTLVQTAKSLFYNTKITETKSTKELYHITNSISARTKCTQLPTTFPLSNLPNLFSEFFQNKISKIWSDLDLQPCASHSLDKPFSGVPLLSFMPVSKKTVREILNKSAPKTCDLDPLAFYQQIPHLWHISSSSQSRHCKTPA